MYSICEKLVSVFFINISGVESYAFRKQSICVIVIQQGNVFNRHQSCSLAAKAERRLYCQIRIDLLVPNFLIFDIGTGK